MPLSSPRRRHYGVPIHYRGNQYRPRALTPFGRVFLVLVVVFISAGAFLAWLG